MNNYEKIFTDAIWSDLKQRIKGKIFAGIRNNILKVSVKCDELYFEMFEENVAERICSGELNANVVVNSFEQNYRRYAYEQTNKRLFY